MNRIEEHREPGLRQQVYLLLSTLLREVPGPDLLKDIHKSKATWETGNDELDNALNHLGESVDKEQYGELEDEYHRLFIGVTQGQLLPYASWYLAGSLHEAPLAELRCELMQLGIERIQDQKEPEDHLAALFETMAWLSTEDRTIQRTFFAKYIGGWGLRFFDEMENAATTHFYGAVALLGRVWMQYETRILD